jgi:osmoprotectant transport system ATP-binding protein
MVEALTLADRIVVMRAGEVRQVATPRVLVSAPADDYVARLVDVVREQGRQLQALAAPDRPARPAPQPERGDGG